MFEHPEFTLPAQALRHLAVRVAAVAEHDGAGGARLRAGRHHLPVAQRAPLDQRVFFDPAKVSAAIVTCGGLCPGINDVIRVLVMELHYRYGCRRILGVRYGYQGFARRADPPPMDLTPEMVLRIHRDPVYKVPIL